MLFDTAFFDFDATGIGLNVRGEMVGAFGISHLSSSLVHGKLATAGVEQFEQLIYGTFVYPNPATDVVKIHSIHPHEAVHIIDLLGRDVLQASLSSEANATLNISSLPRGIYMVMLDDYGYRVTVGKLAVVDR
jgi:hypothetical protein